MFNLARRLSPSIIFIDEIDALLERRSSISGRSSRLEIVNEFMSQWDGLSSNLNSGVIVMGATNRPFVLDDAVLRRLPRRLMVDLPNSENRLKILKNLLRDNLCEVDLLESLPELADKMEFYSGSDLKNVAISAALKSAMRIASRGGCEDSDLLVLSKRDFEEAVREVPASLSDQMDSLIDLRKWNQTYGETKGKLFNSSALKFGFA
jgi:SpoVK/Ycf46/Vps4 family AAA+-type ATPase